MSKSGIVFTTMMNKCSNHVSLVNFICLFSIGDNHLFAINLPEYLSVLALSTVHYQSNFRNQCQGSKHKEKQRSKISFQITVVEVIIYCLFVYMYFGNVKNQITSRKPKSSTPYRCVVKRWLFILDLMNWNEICISWSHMQNMPEKRAQFAVSW